MAISFRSESEWVPCTREDSPIVGGCDPVLFYSPEYEQNLLDEFLPLSQTRSDFMSKEPEWMAEQSQTACPSSPDDDFFVVDYEPSLSPVPSPVFVSTSSPPRAIRRPLRYTTTNIIPQVRKRGRPAGQTSGSKMATYAKNYREMKKAETRQLADRVEALEEENALLRKEAENWKMKYDSVMSDMNQMKKTIVKNEEIASLVTSLSQNNPDNDWKIRLDQNGRVEILKTSPYY